MNQRSIGIEHVDNGNYTAPRTDALYETSAKLVADICKYYKIPCNRQFILKHNEVVATGCPHNLDIDRIIRQANAILNPPTTDYKKLYEDMKVKYDEKVKLETFLRGEIEKKDKTISNLNNRLAQIKALSTV
jgi:N-acetylmuramoyl-L-alanine amidase CwlA